MFTTIKEEKRKRLRQYGRPSIELLLFRSPDYLVSLDMAPAVLGVLTEAVKREKESSESRTGDSRVQAAEFRNYRWQWRILVVVDIIQVRLHNSNTRRRTALLPVVWQSSIYVSLVYCLQKFLRPTPMMMAVAKEMNTPAGEITSAYTRRKHRLWVRDYMPVPLIFPRL